MIKLVLMRHGESQWNLENRFTGWADVPLSEQGVKEANAAGKMLKDAGFQFDIAFTSVLKRAIKTLWLALEELDQMWIPVVRDSRINERMYGSLQGLNKSETAELHGEEQVLVWRRSYDIPPPSMELSDPGHPSHDRRYAGIEVPSTECLKDTVDRFVPYYEEAIVPQLKAGKSVLVAAHGNTLRALVKHLDGISDEDILNLNIPTALPLVYELDENLKPVKSYYLGDADEAKRRAEAVANQGKKG